MLTNTVVFPVHAYNGHLPPSTGGVDVHTHNLAPNGIATNTTATAMVSGGVHPPKRTGSRPKPHPQFAGTVAIPTNTTPVAEASRFVTPGEAGSSEVLTSPTDNVHSNEDENDVHVVPHGMYMAYGPRSPSNPYGVSSFNGRGVYEGVQGGRRYADTPEMVVPAAHTSHLQTPVLIEPLSHTRKRVDAMTGRHQKSSIPTPPRDPSPVGGDVDLNGNADALASASSPRSRQELFRYGPPSSATGQPFVHLTYVPPKNPEDNSLFETDTELEGDGRSDDLEFETEVEEGFQEQEQETEMGVTMLSRSKSTASGSGGRTRPLKGWTSRRASVGVVAVDRRRSVGYAANHNTGKKPESTSHHPSGSSRPRAKLKPADDPSVYIRRRGTLPEPSSSKKFFGWEFGSDPVPPEKKVGGSGGGGLRRNWTERVGSRSRYAMAEVVNDPQQEQESSFIDLTGDNGFERGVGLGLGRKAGGGGGKEEGKTKGGSGVVEPEKSQIEHPPRRKLKKKSKSSLRADSAFAPPVSHQKRTSITRPLSVVLAAAPPSVSQSKSGAFSFGRLGHHRLGSGSSSRPGTADSQASKASNGSMSGKEVVKRGLQLKKSFKLGVGRTLGPNLTLTVGMSSKVALESTRKASWRTSSIVAESIPEDDDDDDDDEMESIAAAKLVSASIARSTPASTILATPTPTPTSGGDLPVKGRPTLAVITTSLPSSAGSAPGLPYSSHTPPTTSSPASGKMSTTAPNRWKPHPFADFVEGDKATRNHIAEVANDVEDDVVQLEHEMEAIRGRRSDTEKDSPRKLHAAGGILQKRLAMSSSPSPKSEWAPQPSSASSTAGGFRFPMIFGNDPPSNMYQHAQQSSSQVRLQTSSTPSTPRGQSTMRLSAVRNALAGVGARMSRMSVNSSTPSTMRGGPGCTFSDMVMETNDGDFMDLRDPFASPPAAATLVTPTKKTLKNGAKAKEGDNFLVIDAYGPNDVEGGDGRRRMSAWGKLPMPTRPFSPAGTSTVGTKRNTNSSNRSSRSGAKAAIGHRKQKKEKRARKTTLPSMASALGAMKGVALRIGEEDADFGIEEALLSQRLLKRLNADGWESRA